MRLSDIMSSDVETISVRESAEVAWQRMRLNDFRHIIVLDGRDVVGIVSTRDLGGPHGESLRHNRQVKDLMTTDMATAGPSTTVREAANLLRGRSIGCLPVLDNNRLVGIVTISDLLELVGRGYERTPTENERKPGREFPPSVKPGTK